MPEFQLRSRLHAESTQHEDLCILTNAVSVHLIFSLPLFQFIKSKWLADGPRNYSLTIVLVLRQTEQEGVAINGALRLFHARL